MLNIWKIRGPGVLPLSPHMHPHSVTE